VVAPLMIWRKVISVFMFVSILFDSGQGSRA